MFRDRNIIKPLAMRVRAEKAIALREKMMMKVHYLIRDGIANINHIVIENLEEI